MNDKCAKFPAIYHNILYNMSEIYLLLDFLQFVILLPALVLVDLLAGCDYHLVKSLFTFCLPFGQHTVDGISHKSLH